MRGRTGPIPLPPWLVAILTVLLGGGITVGIALDSGDDGGKPGVRIVVQPTRSGKAVQAPAPAVAAAANGAEDVHLGPGADTPAVVRSTNSANSDAPPSVPPGALPLASPFQAGCVTRSNRYNYSARTFGVRPSVGTLHLPVAANRTGWSDVSGVHIFLDRPQTQASANYENDDEGHCILSVSEALKAWAQANGNGATACSVEQQAVGSEAQFFRLNGPGLRQLARIFHDCFKRWHIKTQRAIISGCRVIREGLADHNAWGACGGGHVDVHGFGAKCRQQGRYADTRLCVDVVLAVMRKLDGPQYPPITARQRARCRALSKLYPWRDQNAKQRKRRQAIKAGQRTHHIACNHKTGVARRPA